MKFNEPVTPKGIGRNQVAFNLPVNGQLINIIEQEEGDSTTEVNIQEAVSRSVGLSRVIAHSAASSAIANNYSSPFGLNGIENFTIPTSINGSTSWHEATVKFSHSGADWPANDNFYLSADSTTIIPRRSGWYMVNSMFYLGDHSGNHVYIYNAYPADQVEDELAGGDYLETQEHPTLRFSHLIPVIGFDAYGKTKVDPYGFGTDYPLGGIKLNIKVYGNTQAINVTSTNSQAWVQCMWLSPLSEAITRNPA
jgi:hypothetical protein